MFQNERIIAGIVEAMLPTFSGKLALRMVFDLGIDHYSEGDTKEIHARHFVEFTFHRPSNYTRVYVRDAKSTRQFGEVYHRTSDHDSCWRSDGMSILTELYFKMREPFTKAGLKPYQISDHDIFALSGEPHYLTIEDREAIDKDSSYPKLYKLTLGPRVPLGKIHEHLTKTSGA